MYDELVKRLRICATEAGACKACELNSNPSCTDHLMKQAADAIEKLTDNHVGKWIPVTERLPSQNGEYLVAYKLQTIPPIWQFNVYPFALDLYKTDKFDFPRKKYKGKSGFYFYDSEYGFCEDSRVTHWMPLPEPPKEE